MSEPLAVHRRVTSWTRDPLVGGGWSHSGRFGSPELRDVLATPICQRVVLAGEATSSAWGGHLAGAHLSGLRAADDLFMHLEDLESVVVIGAGCAGLSAAQKLAAGGVRVLVVEAASVMGGRARTESLGPAAIDLGANWLHRSERNPLTAHARAAGLKLLPTTMHDSAYVTVNGLNGVAGEEAERFHRALTDAYGYGYGPSTSVAEWLSATTDDRTDDVTRHQVAYGILTMDTGANLTDINMANALDEVGVGLDGGDLSIVGGMTALLDGFGGDYTVETNTAVHAIDWSSGREVVVETSGKRRVADAVVVTVSLGVLKAGDIRFEPPLPPAHQEAVAKLGFGAAEKGFLLYDDRWWPELPAQDVRWYDGPGTLWGEFFDFTDVYGVPAILALAAGDGARCISKLEQDDACNTLEGAFAQLVTSLK